MKCFCSLINSFACISLIAILFSCKKEITYEGPEGELKGRVKLFDNTTTLTDYSGVKVMIDGTLPILKTITNENGEYSFTGLKTGIYDIIFSKEGYATYKMVSFQFIGGNVPFFVELLTLFKIPDVEITNLKVDTNIYGNYGYYIRVSCSLSSVISTYFRYYISNDPTVSYTNYQATDLVYSYNNGTLSFVPSSVLLSRFPKGKQLYIIVYPGSITGNPYIDINTGIYIYNVNTTGASAVVPFIIPNEETY